MKKLFLFLVFLIAVTVGLMALFPEETARLGMQAERNRSGLEHKTIQVGSETWHYLTGGSPEAETILMLHGFGGDKDNWTRFAAHLTSDYHVIAPDLPGFGESARHPAWDYSLPPQRSRVHGFVQAMGLKKFHLVGNSMGGHLTALYTHKYPGQVLTMALFNNAGINSPQESDLQKALAQGDNPLIVEREEDFDRLMNYVAYKQPFIPWPVRGVLARKAVEHSEFNEYIYQAYKSDRMSGLEPILADIENPSLILWGEFDRLLHVSSVDVMKPLLPQVEVVIMKDTGHVPMIERPAETAAHYHAFIEKY